MFMKTRAYTRIQGRLESPEGTELNQPKKVINVLDEDDRNSFFP